MAIGKHVLTYVKKILPVPTGSFFVVLIVAYSVDLSIQFMMNGVYLDILDVLKVNMHHNSSACYPFFLARCLSSTGLIADNHPDLLGEYQWTKDIVNCEKVYKHVDQEYYLLSTGNQWRICPSAENTNCTI